MRTFPALLLTGALALTMTPSATADPRSPSEPDDPRHQQTSDGVQGEIAKPVPEGLRGRVQRTFRSRWQVAPGVKGRIWDERDTRGRARYYLLRISSEKAGLRLDYANDGAVKKTAPVSQMLSRTPHAVAGVNGDFFDIGDTGAPLGIGRDRRRGLLNAPAAGWNAAFWLGQKGAPQIGILPLSGTAKERPHLRISNVNSPEVRIGGIGAYTSAWGWSSGYRVTGGQTQNVRMVVVRDGRVVANRAKLPSGKPIRGTMLVGRGEGAERLKNQRKGMKLTLDWQLDRSPKMAITGNKILLRDGELDVVDDRELHPRTAIGVDRDHQQILLLVVDGRQSFSRGNTMVELARQMKRLGAENALNLDGGGSSTMIAHKRGRNRLVNSPSDGSQRSVANGLEVIWTKPPGKR